jgi:hypothetical protein
VRKRVEVKVVSVRLSHLPWSMPMKTLANVICHLVAMGSPSEPLSEVFYGKRDAKTHHGHIGYFYKHRSLNII